MLRKKFENFLEREWLRSFQRFKEGDCMMKMQPLAVLSEELVISWASITATYHKNCKDDLIRDLKGDRSLHYRRGNRLVIDQLITDYINPRSIIIKTKDYVEEIVGIDVDEEKSRIKLSEILTRDILIVILKCPHSLEGLFTYLSNYSEKNPLYLVDIERIHENMFDVFEVENEKVDELALRFKIEEEDMIKIFDWEHKDHSEFILAFMRYSIGMPALKDGEAFLDFKKRAHEFQPIIHGADELNTIHLKLGIFPEMRFGNGAFAQADTLYDVIRKEVSRAGKKYGAGGYMEVRPFYTTPAYTEDSWVGSRWRTMHMGIDIWSEAGTFVHAPVRCEVYSVYDNDLEGDYGPTIILKVLAVDIELYLLYGHLSRESLEAFKKGDIIEPGAITGSIGTEAENGGWPPHLHFQLIRDIFHHKHNYYGLCDPQFSDFWKEICPSPYPFLQLNNDIVVTYRERASEGKYVYQKGAVLYNSEGQRFLNFREKSNGNRADKEEISKEDIITRHEDISQLLRKEVFLVFMIKVVSELKWKLEIGKSFSCIDSTSIKLIENIRALLERGKILVSHDEHFLYVHMPSQVTRKEVEYFISVLHEIERKIDYA